MKGHNPPGQFMLSTKIAKPRAHKAGAARASLFAHSIEGELLVVSAMAKRLGISTNAMRKRINKASYPLTWEALKR
ncbi:hypothetical protein [Xanthomonas phage XAJ2]|uniref:Uncharacterized protein n=1 Tax=Xanthomonas phage XAJ2 TaxID=1775249 RepID=A0A1I9L2G9_9CAUD|nr:hypothetical protein [Xanthomonas phage XAJ2]